MSLPSEADSQDTEPTTISIAPLQDVGTMEGKQGYNVVNADDPSSFDLVEPSAGREQTYSLEDRADLLFSKRHLEAIFDDARLFLKFTTFLSKNRPQSVPLLIYYLDSLKALKAIAYSNAIVDGLEPTSIAEFTATPPKISFNASLKEKSDRAFAILTQEDLPAYITHIFVDIVSSSIHRKITGTMAPQLLQASEGLAEVFCVSDMSKPDNPIVFSSEEFHRTTQYGLNYAIGRNCRFLQGPKSSPSSVRRLREAIRNGREHQETFLNYRRDGSVFMNLLTMAPLLDNQGKVRYYIGAQVDVSGLVKECTNLEALVRLIAEQESRSRESEQNAQSKEKKDEFQSLCEMFNQSELETVRVHGGRMHSEQHELDDGVSVRVSNRPRLLIRESSSEEVQETRIEDDLIPPRNSISPSPATVPAVGRLPGVFAHYLVMRPYPSLRITFTSPSLRVPGLLQSPFLSRIGGSPRVREELTLALSEGRNVTAKVRWLNVRVDESADGDLDDYRHMSQAGKARWIHCTPLLSSNRTVGAWMVIMIDGDDLEQTRSAEAERIGVVSPSWGRRSEVNGAASAARTRMPTGKPAQYIRDPSTKTGPSSTEINDWDLDLDIATASVQLQTQQPTLSNNSMLGSSGRSKKSRTQASILAAGPASPPPHHSIPPPPAQGYSPPTNNPGSLDLPRGYAGKIPSRSHTGTPIPQPHNTHEYKNTTSSASNQPTTNTQQNTYAEHTVLPPTASASGRAAHSFTTPPFVGSTSASSLPSSQSHQNRHQPQPQLHPPSPAPAPAPVTVPSQSPRDFQPAPRLHGKVSAPNMSKKSATTFGQRVFQGFRKADKDKDKEKGKEPAPSASASDRPGEASTTQPLVISAPILQGSGPQVRGATHNLVGQRFDRAGSAQRSQAASRSDTGAVVSESSSSRTSRDRFTLT